MTNYDLEEDRLLRYQICLSIIFIFTLIISIFLSYNAMMKCEKKCRVFSDEDAAFILKLNRMIAILVSISFLLINIYDKSVKEKYNLEDKNADYQIMASFFTLISSLIVLYVAFNSDSDVAYENPEI